MARAGGLRSYPPGAGRAGAGGATAPRSRRGLACGGLVVLARGARNADPGFRPGSGASSALAGILGVLTTGSAAVVSGYLRGAQLIGGCRWCTGTGGGGGASAAMVAAVLRGLTRKGLGGQRAFCCCRVRCVAMPWRCGCRSVVGGAGRIHSGGSPLARVKATVEDLALHRLVVAAAPSRC